MCMYVCTMTKQCQCEPQHITLDLTNKTLIRLCNMQEEF